MGAELIILANPYTYNFIKGLTHSALAGTACNAIIICMIGENDNMQRQQDVLDENMRGAISLAAQ